MAFTNETVDLSTPTIAELSLNPISPKYRVINITATIFVVTLGLVIISIFRLGLLTDTSEWLLNNASWLYAGIIAVGLLFVAYHYFADPLIQYAVREHDVHFQSGLFFRKLISQPILRVQHIELKRGPIERKAGLATLQIFSAGGASHTFEIPGLEYDKAISLRQFIINHSDLFIDE